MLHPSSHFSQSLGCPLQYLTPETPWLGWNDQRSAQIPQDSQAIQARPWEKSRTWNLQPQWGTWVSNCPSVGSSIATRQLRHAKTKTQRCGKSASVTWMERPGLAEILQHLRCSTPLHVNQFAGLQVQALKQQCQVQASQFKSALERLQARKFRMILHVGIAAGWPGSGWSRGWDGRVAVGSCSRVAALTDPAPGSHGLLEWNRFVIRF